ncbi:pentapeptide repeat-containing protein [Nocardia sp. CA-084685]|uniref:pentapeptide repeat-containing protein n=1 Tax=Nocardia sp. CA-084685 TaxID=3239970 RepID=UPI003D97BC86
MPGRVNAIGSETRRTAAALRGRMSKSYKAISHRIERLRLLPVVCFALGAGLVVAVATYGFLHQIMPASQEKAAPIDITRVSLTVVAGVGGVVALVIAYRRQRDIEQSRFVERFGAAAGQLGASDVAVRIAGVYAMAGAADESDGLRRQQCIDVLCGYLRLPYDPDHGGSARTKLVTTIPRADGGETEEHIEYRQNDREVRRTIVRVIADHLHSEAEYSWSTSNFDFRTAHLEEATFSAATFSGNTWFDRATFDGAAHFDKATFNGPAGFDGTTFNGPAAFGGAAFNSRTRFSETTFNSGAEFRQVILNGDARFYRAIFNGHAEFQEATFNGAEFYRATFDGHAWFHHATFKGDTIFHGARFYGRAEFNAATFNGAAEFRKATFDGRTAFQDTTFNGDAQFAEATFNGGAEFTGVRFTGPTTFSNADFGSEQVVFDRPAQWGPPAPAFDWAQDVAVKPVNVGPQDWPPATASA